MEASTQANRTPEITNLVVNLSTERSERRDSGFLTNSQILLDVSKSDLEQTIKTR